MTNQPSKDDPQFEGYCPACGEPLYREHAHHSADCPYAGDDLPPEEGNH
jgi:hypothetical protein